LIFFSCCPRTIHRSKKEKKEKKVFEKEKKMWARYAASSRLLPDLSSCRYIGGKKNREKREEGGRTSERRSHTHVVIDTGPWPRQQGSAGGRKRKRKEMPNFHE